MGYKFYLNEYTKKRPVNYKWNLYRVLMEHKSTYSCYSTRIFSSSTPVAICKAFEFGRTKLQTSSSLNAND